ncbi:MAG: CxxC-x17-CxxC domain-containing protein [Candidatus Paceibacterota bacterium]
MSEFKKSKFSNSRPNTPRAFSRTSSSRPSFGGGAPRFNARDSGPSESFKTSCSKCNKACEVPFKPNGKKPVFCRDCFVRDDAPRGNDRGFDRAPERTFAPKPVVSEDPRIGAMQKELATVHAKLDMLIGTLQGAAYSSILAKSQAIENSDSREVKSEKSTTPSKSPAKISIVKKAVKKISKKKV